MLSMLIQIVLFLALIESALAHSWVECTDYEGTITGNDYNPALCKGYARDWPRYRGSIFGLDRGFNFNPNSRTCITSYDPDRSYSAQFPKATYTQGESIRVLWPAKNHQADTCTNPFIPDTSMKLFVTCGNSQDPDLQTFTQESNLVIDWKQEGNRKGFQNCPKFCDNPDKAVCFQDFTVPENLPAGQTCTFLWYWIFNPGEIYTTCWEADIVAGDGSGGSPVSQPTNRPTNQPTSQPTNRPTNQPTNRPTNQPTNRPTSQPVPSNPGNPSPSTGFCSDQPLLVNNDLVKFFNIPSTVRAGDQVTVQVSYASRPHTGEKYVVSRFVDSSFNEVGSAMIEVNALDSACVATMTIPVSQSVSQGDNLILESWIINQNMYNLYPDAPWKYALHRVEQSDIRVSSTTSYE